MSSESDFVHRYCADGTIELICRNCFAMVAAARHEADLEKSEGEHACAVSNPRIIPAPEPAH